MSGPTIEQLADTEVLFVPTARVRAGEERARLQLRRRQSGEMALLAYTSLDLLVAGCGPDQAWIAAPVEELVPLQEAAGFDVIVLNADLPQDWRDHGAAGHEQGAEQ